MRIRSFYNNVMNKMVSIIVPVYNAEKTLEKCVRSLIEQTYSNIEIILVNDGSKDNSLSICRKFEKNDNRVVVLDKPNGGVSSARNAGLDIAKGDFVMFCDSDDFVSNIIVELMVKKYSPNNLLMCEFKCFNYEISLDEVVGVITQMELVHLCKSEFIKYWNMGIGSPTTKLFDNRVITKYNVRFPLELNLGEDLLFVLEYLSRIKGDIELLPIPLYYYKVDQTDTLSKSVQSLSQICFYYSKLMEYFNKLNVVTDECRNLLCITIMRDLEKLLIQTIKSSDRTYFQKRRECRKIFASKPYKKCCKTNISSNFIYRWALSYKVFFLLYLILN